jgi:hypothetical protein
MGFSSQSIAGIGIGDRNGEEANAANQKNHVRHVLLLGIRARRAMADVGRGGLYILFDATPIRRLALA